MLVVEKETSHPDMQGGLPGRLPSYLPILFHRQSRSSAIQFLRTWILQVQMQVRKALSRSDNSARAVDLSYCTCRCIFWSA